MIALSQAALDAPYWNALADGRLSLPRCGGCARWQWPAVARCGECGHWGSDWQDLPLTGKVFSWTRTWHYFGGTEGLERPFISLLAEIDGTDRPGTGGIRLMGLLEGVAPDAPVPSGARIEGRIGSTAYGDDSLPVILWQLAD
jgi:uncharacterized OB-fold protein